MKKLIIYLFVIIFFQYFSIANAKWLKSHCENIENLKIKCVKITDERLLNQNSLYKKKSIYIGNEKNGLPFGKGKVEIFYSNYSQKDWDNEIQFFIKNMKGEFIFQSDQLIELVNGSTELNAGIKEYVENSSVVKAVYPSGIIQYFKNDVLYKRTGPNSTFEGSFDNQNRPYEGTIIFKNGDKFVGKFKNEKVSNGIYYYYSLGYVFDGIFDNNSPKDGKFKFENGQISYIKNGTEYKRDLNGIISEGSFYTDAGPKGGLKKGTVIFQPNSNYKKYIGTLNKNGQPIEGTLYFKNGQTINYNAGKSTNLVSSNVLPGKKFHINPYLIFTIVVVGIFLFYKFNDDKYEKKRNKRKLPLIEQITGFMNSPVGTGILMLIIGIALFNLFNWATTDLEPGAPAFFTHDGG